MPATLRIIKTLWGIRDPISVPLFQSIQQEGYAGVEVVRPAWLDADTLVEALNKSSLCVVCQIHTAGGILRKNNEYVYCGAYNVDSHKEDFERQLNECTQLIARVNAGGFVNVHAGVDAWSDLEALDFLEFALAKVDQASTVVAFETHRQRLFCNPFQTRTLLKKLQSPIKLNADLSHWYVSCERVLDSSDERDAVWWTELLETLTLHVKYIHARYGWNEGPQMADPSVPACDRERKLQEATWKVLMKSMMQQSNGEVFVSPEFGPPPYMAVLPKTQEPVASLPAAVSYTKGRLETLFDEIKREESWS